MNVRDRKNLPMLGVDRALQAVMDATPVLGPEEISLEQAGGRWLAGELVSSADMPPFDRTAMDGFAVRSTDVAEPPVELEIVEEIPAGRDPSVTVGPGQASRIMTGAMIPPGADTIVMVEHTEEPDAGRVRVLKPSPEGRHIRRAGEDLKAGSTLLPRAARLDAAALALLAAEGRARVAVHALPSVGLLSTGDELVGMEATPRGSQIREVNSWSLRALLAELGIRPRLLGIARDDRGEIGKLLEEGTGMNVLLVSGGVSMGEHDLVGACLKEAGCRAVFERVAIQPGKPLFFGVISKPGVNPPVTLVFGLPGNPVSAIVDFLVFARPALRKLMGDPRPVEPLPAARLDSPVRRRAGRRGYLPARLALDPSGDLRATPVPSMGSADMVALGRAGAFLIAPEDLDEIPAGHRVRVLPLHR